MPYTTSSDSHRLLAFNRTLLAQAFALAGAFQGPARRAFAEVVGPHLRHLIEHYEALLLRDRGMPVDYDRRARDAQLQACPDLAQARLSALQQRLGQWPVDQLDEPLMVLGQGGLVGEFQFAVASSLGRELAFLGSHSVHHFAILKAHCLQRGIPLAADFGKAPATVAHERALASRTSSASVAALQPLLSPQHKEVSCTASIDTR